MTAQRTLAELPAEARARKAARIWKRTWVGFLLAGAVAALLVAAYASETGAVVLAVGAVAMIGGVGEAARMGRLRGRGLLVPLAVAGGAVVAALSEEVPHPEAHMAIGWRYLEAAALAPLVGGLGGLLLFRGIANAAAALVASAVCVAHLVRPEWIDPRWLVVAIAGLALAVCLPAARAREVRRNLLLLGFLGAWLVPGLPALFHVWRGYGPDGLTALIVLAKIGDVFGYYVGNAMGRTHPFPGISPGKTTAGCVGSLVATTATGGVLVATGLLPSGSLGVVGGLLAGAVVNVAAQAGDLLESRVKRGAKVKDSGAWFGPAGGVLDLSDSLLLAVPAALGTWPWLLGGGA